MKKTAALVLLLLLAFSLAAESITGKVIWVYDGDTFLLQNGQNSVEIRLWGIDAPEYKQSGGREATKFLIRLIKGRDVKVEKIDQDSYGRIVAKVYFEDVYINLEIIKNGHAWWYQHYAPKARAFREAEAVARDQKAGLWRDPNPIDPREWREQHNKDKDKDKDKKQALQH
jgi:endonuclease YncB( thermonuclease family)